MKIKDPLKELEISEINNLSLYEKEILTGWSWGGSFSSLLFFIGNSSWGLVLLYFIGLLIPIINIIVVIGFFIFGGLEGKNLILYSNKYKNKDEQIGALKVLETQGKFLSLIFSLIFLISLIFTIYVINIFIKTY